MVQHGDAGHVVQDFGQARLHPGSLASSQYDNVNVGHRRSVGKKLPQPDYRLSVRTRPKWAPSVTRLGCRRFEGSSKGVVGPEGIQVRIVACQCPILGIDGDGALEMRDRCRMFAPLSM